MTQIKVWMAVDANGYIGFFPKKPRRDGDVWLGMGYQFIHLDGLKGAMKWEDEPKQVTITVED